MDILPLIGYDYKLFEQLSVPEYRDNFILKGGILVSSIVGMDRRSTMDIDTTIRKMKLSIEDASSTQKWQTVQQSIESSLNRIEKEKHQGVSQ